MTDQGLLHQTRMALEEAGIRPRRSLGQNYVVDGDLISCMIEAAGASKAETVLEIGPGIGTLTARLAERAGRVIAVEKDHASATFLMRKAWGGNVAIVEGDILEMPLPEAGVIVSNLPYSISTPITFKLLFEGRFRLAVLTYQKEVAERLVAGAGDKGYSRLSVATSLLAEVKTLGEFPPDAFYPRPEVGSAVVALRRRASGIVDWEWMDETLRLLFSQRRRTLRKAMETYAKIKGLEAGAVSSGMGPELLSRRVYELQPADFVRVAGILKGVRGNRAGGVSCGELG